MTPDPAAASTGWQWAVAVPWAARVAVAVILLQTLHFKFTDAPQTASIFDGRGVRPAANASGGTVIDR